MKSCLLGFLLAVLATVGGSAVFAAPVTSGFDLFHTEGAKLTLTDASFGGTPLLIELQSLPDGPGDTDLVIARKAPANPPIGSTELVPVEVVALSLQSAKPIELDGILFDVNVTETSSDLSGFGELTIFRADADGGTFSGEVPLHLQVLFTEVGQSSPERVVEVSTEISLQGQWSQEPAPNDAHNSEFPADGFHITNVTAEPSPELELILRTSRAQVNLLIPEPGTLYSVAVALATLLALGRYRPDSR